MLKSKKVILLIMFITLIFAGCAIKNSKQANQANLPKAQGNSQAQNASGSRYAGSMIRGSVQSVAGNQVSLKVIEAPQFRRGSGQGFGRRMEGRQGQQLRSEQPGRQAQRRDNPIKYTGETKIITIPDNIKITKMERSNKGIVNAEVKLKDLKKDDILQVWYSDKEKSVITRVNCSVKQ
jgi:protein involved in sex pheromone biosynthesis